MIFSAISCTSLVNKPWYRELFGNLEILCEGEVGQFDNRFNTGISEEQYLQNIVEASKQDAAACHAPAEPTVKSFASMDSVTGTSVQCAG